MSAYLYTYMYAYVQTHVFLHAYQECVCTYMHTFILTCLPAYIYM